MNDHICEVCGTDTSKDAGRCTNDRCATCHRHHCSSGGERSPGHARRWPDNDRFHAMLVTALDATGLDDRGVAEVLEVAVPVVYHWRHGITLPHPNLRTAVMRDLAELRR